jgi:hypothetical protein
MLAAARLLETLCLAPHIMIFACLSVLWRILDVEGSQRWYWSAFAINSAWIAYYNLVDNSYVPQICGRDLFLNGLGVGITLSAAFNLLDHDSLLRGGVRSTARCGLALTLHLIAATLSMIYHEGFMPVPT